MEGGALMWRVGRWCGGWGTSVERGMLVWRVGMNT